MRRFCFYSLGAASTYSRWVYTYSMLSSTSKTEANNMSLKTSQAESNLTWKGRQKYLYADIWLFSFFSFFVWPTKNLYVNECTVLKGAGSRDRIKIFWQKWIQLGLKRNIYLFFNIKNGHLLLCPNCIFFTVKVKTYGRNTVILLVMSLKWEFHSVLYYFISVSPPLQ